MTSDLLWPRYANPADLPRSRRSRCRTADCRQTTYALLARAATLWPERTAVTVLPDAARWQRAAAAHVRASCSPTCTATPTCCTRSACAAATRSR